jgi:hypothetical protein
MEKEPILGDQVREKRKIYRFKSGASYEGEWIGYKRDGFGI